jgi:hypothetical protein
MQVALASRCSPTARGNEDFIAATEGVVVVLDGATVPPGLATGCIHGTAWFARRLGARLLDLATDGRSSSADCLAQAIAEVASLHRGTCDLVHPGSPSATVALLRDRRDRIDYLVLGDATILLDGTDWVRVVTDDRLEDIARPQRAAMLLHPTGSAAQRPLLERLVIKQRSHRNRPRGYWIASSDPAAARHALIGATARRGVRRAAALTDGATRVVDRFGLLSWRGLLDLLETEGPEALITLVRRAERSDPDGRAWPRGKRHDDASAAFCLFPEPVL